MRAQYERATEAFPVSDAVQVKAVAARTVRGEWLTPDGAADAVMLYLHGGGYVIGSPRSHRHLAAAISLAAGVRTFTLDYRLAPEHPHPAALDDAIAAYRWLRTRNHVPAQRIVIAGDSAGGGLALALLVALRDAGEALPASAVLLSPWVDLSCNLPSCQPGAVPDPVIDPQVIRAMARAYMGRRNLRQPRASPLFADLRGLPQLLVQAGGAESLLDDALQIAMAASRAGVHTTLEVWPRMIHVWQWYAPILDDGRVAIKRIAEFTRDALTRSEAV
ncbi:alpha/beta hydrolase [Piscinibacter sakaiensis]|uniref:alpha/beta hydrolase n=1 Tax=Piscinibacter sakaiensis TaxID=1547922 RepID=UPI003AAA58E2